MNGVYFVIHEDTRQERLVLRILRDLKVDCYQLEHRAQAPSCTTPIFVHSGAFLRTDSKGSSRTLHTKILRTGRQPALFKDFKCEPEAWVKHTSTCVALRPFSESELICPIFAMRLRTALYEARRVCARVAAIDYEKAQKELRDARKRSSK